MLFRIIRFVTLPLILYDDCTITFCQLHHMGPTNELIFVCFYYNAHFMMRANNCMHYGLKVVLICLYITSVEHIEVIVKYMDGLSA